ncbi:hypothetical protein [Marinobacterium mangrovicola]|uniref:Uncharacterized protein n=1 Tax=Marinobacterium mangrovicola TaxID=1476959 RepID=A0A4R1G7W6_9GAMM|nr:hypothetical protein [Marinobacterium mangrovicola]TCK02673.1 hypothetical protein CLV83_4370 [Marinobacterium mangrovicola]
MIPFIRTILTTTGISVAAFYGLSALIDGIAPSPYGNTTTAEADDPEPDPEFSQQIERLMDGADPSDIFEPTAAGSPPVQGCLYGWIEMPDEQESGLDGLFYVARRSDNLTYILPLPGNHNYLVQHPFQSVTANRLENIPATIKTALQEDLQRLSQCQQRNYFFSAINDISP